MTVRRMLKWLLVALAAAVAGAAAVVFTSLPAPVPGVAVEQATARDPGERPLSLLISRPAGPTQGRKLPLVVISHGTGGSMRDHSDTAAALAKAGFVVVALDHPGDNYRDLSGVGGGTHLAARPRHITRTIDYMQHDWPRRGAIDANRVGMFGFSAGGFTALVIAGAEPDLSRTADYCRRKPEAWTCLYVKRQGLTQARIARQKATAWQHDPRVKAIAVAAPAVGYSFDRARLAHVRIPVQLWGAEKDTVVEDSAELVRQSLGTAPEYHQVKRAGHFSFMMPCKPQMQAMMTVMHWFGTEPICKDLPGFDRTALHRRFNADVIRFFRQAMPEGG